MPQVWPSTTDDFVPLPYETGWTTGDFGSPPGYSFDGGWVELRGVTRRTTGNITAASVIAELPPDRTPPAVCYFLAQGGGLAVVPIQIDASGEIRVKTPPSVTTPWVSLDGIRFRR